MADIPGLPELKSAVQSMADAINSQIAFTKQQEMTRAELEAYAEEHKKTTENLKSLKSNLKQVGNELLKIGDAGIKFASAIGTSATRGVQLELANRTALISQIKNLITLDANRIVTGEQQRAAQQALTDTFISTREGFELSAKGTQAFAANLKGGFKSEFQLTSESLRALVTTGMATEAQFENFRKASGRASLSSGQFANIVNKNTLSFLLYGPKFAKAAVDAEKLGISLAGVQAAQEGLVTNLDGTIDTVAQLNQLGAQVDFGNLVRIAEQEGPEALLAYARATIPANLLQSTSTRALFKQLGISAEDFLKAGGRQKSAAESIEEQMSQAAEKTNNFGVTLLTIASRTKELLLGSFGAVAVAGYFAAAALTKLGFSAIVSAAAKAASGLASLSLVLIPLTLAIAGIAAIMSGRAKTAEGNRPAGFVRGAFGGSLVGAATVAGLSLAGALPTGGASLIVGGSALLGGLIAANDMVSAGYGSRMLVTPNGAFALNNADDIIAGTNLFPKGALQTGSDNSGLVRKIDDLINTITSANTTINVGGMTQTVPRLRLAQVYSRNEVV